MERIGSPQPQEGPRTDPPRGNGTEGQRLSATADTAPTTSAASSTKETAQPQDSAEAASLSRVETRLSGETLVAEASAPIQSPARVALVQNDSQIHFFGRSFSHSLHRLSSAASSIGEHVQPSSWLGITTDVEEVGGKRTWIIKITKIGVLFVPLHFVFTVAGIFSFITNIVSWTSGNASDKMLQRILQKVSDSGSHLEGVDAKLRDWFGNTTSRTAAEEERLKEEQRLWDALLKVFESCASTPRGENTTSTCNNLRQYFDDHPLPKPDKSPLAKRNMAKLDVIIRRDHLNMPPDPAKSISTSRPQILVHLGVGLLVLMLTSGVVLLGVWMSRRWGSNISRLLGTKAKKEYEEIDENFAEDSDPVGQASSVFRSGWDFNDEKKTLIHRGHRQFDIHAAAARGALDELQSNSELLQQIDIDKVHDEYGTILAAAARSGSLRTVDYILSRKPKINLVGGRYHTALQAAAHSGDSQVVDRLLAAGASEGDLGGFYGTAVNAAAEKGNAKVLESLLTQPNAVSNINQPGGTYGYPLIAAAARGEYTSVELLLSHGAEPGQPNGAGTIALHQAASNGHIRLIELLLQKHSPINQTSGAFGTPLHAACRGLQANAAIKMLESGADPSIKDQRERIPLHDAAQAKGEMAAVVLKILIKRRDLINEVDIDGNTALNLASIAGNLDVVKILLEYDADHAIGDKFNAQPLFRAAGCGHPDIVRELLSKGANPNAQDCFGRTALHGPAQTPDVRIHEWLIEYGADVNIVGNDMKTALHEACNMGRINNVRLLLAKPDVKVNELDNDQFPPLYKALCSSDAHKDYKDKCVDPDIVEMLLARDDVVVNASNGIAVQEAARKGFLGFVSKMLSKDKDAVQIHGGKYGGVLQAAAISGNLELADLLLKPEYHANVNQSGGEFGCPLAAAAAFGHVDVVGRLLEAGANPDVFGVGRYGSPYQSTCQKVGVVDRGWDNVRRGQIATQIRGLLGEHGGPEVARKIEKPYESWRWQLGTTGWAWAPPGEM
ncbi:hypothetical protein LTR10_018016 [Elasticomyces elasticus]|uniref:Uncharacterized protein n=1 Tax=Exophiala sideris TaxID=1016849 RepID=A0ABR0JAP6_9EURO|nr:hypothetical protein LTR10_018016 [Elasticomyces elasticus]KAK5026113.1 hypothetical protein LTS07_007638 [Exophiala sideris]KAK5032367.1 hypothetical protein LTR13_007190 [Exophiala sideris]KAK5059523.1 hypothetical protein LTR69_006112 [Exophiala sideris]KAK5186685.1 hypothetical protein LTR44_000691 [Eurotiomycetes sp. CCFEE 6388]